LSKNLCEILQELGRLRSRKVAWKMQRQARAHALGRSKLTNARAEAQDALLPRGVRWLLEPLSSVIVRPEQAVSPNVLVCRKLAECALKFLQGEVQGVVVNLLARFLKLLQEQIHLPEIPSTLMSASRTSGVVLRRSHPLPSSMIIDPEGIDLTISAAKDSSTSISSLVK
jgi:hypothetical protein